MLATAVLLYLVTISTATFGSFFGQSSTGPSAYNLCVYSKDPSKYAPNCFTCPVAVYATAMQACANATELPSNISYASANCLEKNCAINFPMSSTHKPMYSSPFSLFQQAFPNVFRTKRSVDDNGLTSFESPDDFKIVGGKNTFASEIDIDFDYMT